LTSIFFAIIAWGQWCSGLVINKKGGGASKWEASVPFGQSMWCLLIVIGPFPGQRPKHRVTLYMAGQHVSATMT